MPTPDKYAEIESQLFADRMKEMEKAVKQAQGEKIAKLGDAAESQAQRGGPAYYAAAEMPRYRSHKTVWALKIAAIDYPKTAPNEESDGSAIITPTEPHFAPFKVPHAYMHKHQPKAGGYYVVYEDGYSSWSPAEAFESGYTRI